MNTRSGEQRPRRKCRDAGVPLLLPSRSRQEEGFCSRSDTEDWIDSAEFCTGQQPERASSREYFQDWFAPQSLCSFRVQFSRMRAAKQDKEPAFDLARQGRVCVGFL